MAQSGAVWAMDHVQPPQPVDGVDRQVLAVRDLASGYQLGWLPVAGATAATTEAALAALFQQHGPPLLLKCDNGSAFTAEAVGTLLARWQVHPLLSPPATPQYNVP